MKQYPILVKKVAYMVRKEAKLTSFSKSTMAKKKQLEITYNELNEQHEKLMSFMAKQNTEIDELKKRKRHQHTKIKRWKKKYVKAKAQLDQIRLECADGDDESDVEDNNDDDESVNDEGEEDGVNDEGDEDGDDDNDGDEHDVNDDDNVNDEDNEDNEDVDKSKSVTDIEDNEANIGQNDEDDEGDEDDQN